MDVEAGFTVIRLPVWPVAGSAFGWAPDLAPIGFIDGDVMVIQGGAGSPLQRDFRLDVSAFGGDFRRAGLREVILDTESP